jgi:hypothetical protein
MVFVRKAELCLQQAQSQTAPGENPVTRDGLGSADPPAGTQCLYAQASRMLRIRSPWSQHFVLSYSLALMFQCGS